MQQAISSAGSQTISGTWQGTATPFPPNPADGEKWIIGTPVPTVAPPNPQGGAATTGDVIQWTGKAWSNIGKTQGPPGPTI